MRLVRTLVQRYIIGGLVISLASCMRRFRSSFTIAWKLDSHSIFCKPLVALPGSFWVPKYTKDRKPLTYPENNSGSPAFWLVALILSGEYFGALMRSHGRASLNPKIIVIRGPSGDSSSRNRTKLIGFPS